MTKLIPLCSLLALLALLGGFSTGCANTLDVTNADDFGAIRSAVWLQATIDSGDPNQDRTSHLLLASNRPGLCDGLAEAADVIATYSDRWAEDGDDIEAEDHCGMLADYAGELGDALGPVFDGGGRLLTVGYFGDGDGSRPTQPPEGLAGPDDSGFVATLMYTTGSYFSDYAAALTPNCSNGLGERFCCNPAPDDLAAVDLFAIAEDDSSYEVAFPGTGKVEVEVDLTARTPDGSQTLGIEGAWTADACEVEITIADKPYVPFEPFENVGI